MKDIDDIIDDPDLENLVTEIEWLNIEKEKSTDEDIFKLHEEEWYQKIQILYQHFCQGELLDPTQSEPEAIEEESNEEEEEKDPGDI